MRNYFLFICLLLNNIIYGSILPDANTLVLSKILVQGISQVQKMQRTYEKITEFTQIAAQTRNEINSLLKLESDTRNALISATNIKNLKLTDIKFFLAQNLDLKGNIDDYTLPGSSFNKILQNINSKSQDLQWGIKLYDGMQNFSISPGLNMGNYSNQNNIYDRMGLEMYLQDQNSRIFQLMQNYASRYEEQAMELEALIKTDNLYSMNTSERMNLMIQASNLLERAFKLRMESNKILESPPGETLRSQNKTLELVLSQKDFSNRIQFSKEYSQVYNP